MKIRPVGPELLHADERADGQTDQHDEVNCHFFAILRTRQNKTTPNKFLFPKTIRLYQIRRIFATKHLRVGTVLYFFTLFCTDVSHTKERIRTD